MADGSIKRRRRQPRVDDNPMALLAQQLMAEAKDAFRTADDLSAAMEPHLLQHVSNSAIYQYTADRERHRNVPPGDVLLAAALAAGVSLDQKLGMVRQANDIEILRAQVAEMREEMANLRALVAGGDAAPDRRPDAADIAVARAGRASRRQSWAERSRAGATPPAASSTSTRGAGRNARR